MKIRKVMTTDVEVARPDDSIQSVAKRMAEGDFGFMPVADDEKLLGAITDRDLAIRALARGLPPSTAVSEVMTRDMECAYEDDSLTEVLDSMGSKQIRRMPVVDRKGRLCGVVSLGDLSTKVKEQAAGETLEDISR